jgi:hypothetical protein
MGDVSQEAIVVRTSDSKSLAESARQVRAAAQQKVEVHTTIDAALSKIEPKSPNQKTDPEVQRANAVAEIGHIDAAIGAKLAKPPVAKP